MSRPPRPTPRGAKTGPELAGHGALDYLPSEFADFVERERALATEELGIAPSGQEGDFAETLMDLSALVAHVLGVYQDRFAREAFLRTAQSPQSLVQHGRRLGYEPDPGLAATGYVALRVREGLAGTVKAGFALTSAPFGEKKAQDYETLDDVDVDWRRNDLIVRGKRLTKNSLTNPKKFEVRGAGLGLEAGDVVVIEAASGSLSAHIVVGAREAADGATTEVEVAQKLPTSLITQGFRMYGKPASRLHLFGWDTPSSRFSDAELQAGQLPPIAAAELSRGGSEAEGERVCGYEESSYSDHDLYLAWELDKAIKGTPIVCWSGSDPQAYRVTSERSAAVRFEKRELIKVNGVTWNAKDEKLDPTEGTVPSVQIIAATVTALQATALKGGLISRTKQNIRTSVWLGHWGVVAPLVHDPLSKEPVELSVTIEGSLSGLAPGQLLLLSSDDGAEEPAFQVVEITSVSDVSENEAPASEIHWRVVDSSVANRARTLGGLRIQGNVVRVSHGKAVDEVLGDSDGVTPFLRFTLKHKPLTHLPSPSGGEPVLDVRVGSVLWSRVEDLYDSGPDDRHYILQRDESGATFVVFGDGRRGAIPPSGKKHITAAYRVGLGRDGDADAGQVSRIKRANVLVERVESPMRFSGGADPASPEDVRAQATRFLMTFDRAVSIQDHADLALLFPGVARASAYWAELDKAGLEGIRVIVADAAGNMPGSREVIERFLELRRDSAVPIEVDKPWPTDVRVGVYLEADPAYLPEIVEGAVREALYGEREGAAGLFTFAGRALGQPAFLSELYDVITRVPGVVFAEVTQFEKIPAKPGASGATPRVVDRIGAAPDEWLRLEPQFFSFTPPVRAAS
jgi:hypothetical protein